MAEFPWRRHHDPHIVAEVIPAADGVWSAVAWLQGNPTMVVRSPRRMDSRESACAKADTLARLTFEHRCQTGTCGEWLPFDRDRS
jgi:hypothetical protein